MAFQDQSYTAHQNHIKKHITGAERVEELLALWQSEDDPKQKVHHLFWQLTNPLIQSGATWLTVGDMYGADANYLIKQGADATASDLTESFLKIAFEKGFVKKYTIQNVERLTYTDDAFDFVYCKEAYHHFPRPAIGFYEMLRVSRRGIILQEPVDILSKMPILVFLRNTLDRISPYLLRKIWKNQYSYETVGNFVFKVSEREFEKMAAALNLPLVAYKGFNLDNAATGSSQALLQVKNMLCWLKVIPHEHLSAIIFKAEPDDQTLTRLKMAGYRVIRLPTNPYL